MFNGPCPVMAGGCHSARNEFWPTRQRCERPQPTPGDRRHSGL